MSYKYINEDKFKNDRAKNSRISGIVTMSIGAVFWFIAIFLTIQEHDKGFLIMFGIIGLFFIIGGIYIYNQVKVIEKKLRALDDPNSKSYKKKQAELEEERQRYLKNAEKHKSLKFILRFRKTLISFILTFICVALTLFFMLIGTISIILLIFDFCLIVSFIYTLGGGQYRVLMSGYAEHGLDRDEAESDFAESRAYMVSNDVMSVSSRFFLSTSEAIILSLEDIVWVYSSFDIIDHYRRGGMYDYSTRKYCLMFGLDNGMLIKAQCPESLCPLIIDDVVQNGYSITSGYSDELMELFTADPEHFRNAVKPTENITYTPVGPEFKA